MVTLKDIEKKVVEAIKAGDRTRVDVLRMLVNQIKMVAKNDGNRAVTDDDVITAANRMVKQTKETLSFVAASDPKTAILNNEIAIVEEFLPQKMARETLEALITSAMATAPEGKAAKGHVMKVLNQSYRGQFDGREATAIIDEKLA